MDGISIPNIMLWAGTLSTSAATVYFGAVLTGFYKEPLMARFRRYGEERRPAPAISFAVSLGIWAIMMAMIMRVLTQQILLLQNTLLPLIFSILALMAFGAAIAMNHFESLRVMLPRWYFDLLLIASREERRLIAYAWLRLPRKMRWRLNGDQAAFRVWADMVRITVIYGARDPDDPWAQWV